MAKTKKVKAPKKARKAKGKRKAAKLQPWFARPGTSKAAVYNALVKGGTHKAILAKLQQAKVKSTNLEGRLKMIAGFAVRLGAVTVEGSGEDRRYIPVKKG